MKQKGKYLAALRLSFFHRVEERFHGLRVVQRAAKGRGFERVSRAHDIIRGIQAIYNLVVHLENHVLTSMSYSRS